MSQMPNQAIDHSHAGAASWGNRVVLAAILLNTITLIWGLIDHDEMFETLDVAILWFFVAELTVRFTKAVIRRSLRDVWLWVDIAIIVLALLPLGDTITALRIMRAARLGHLSRHLPHLRHITALRWVTMLARKTAVGG